MRHKMKFAADLLSHPDVLVKQVAMRLEFADQYQFSRHFKRVFGLSPMQFQQHLVARARALTDRQLSVVSCQLQLRTAE